MVFFDMSRIAGTHAYAKTRWQGVATSEPGLWRPTRGRVLVSEPGPSMTLETMKVVDLEVRPRGRFKTYVIVDMTIQGRPFQFMVDSGAGPTLITEETRRQVRPSCGVTDGGYRLRLACGMIEQLGLATLPGPRLEGVGAGGAASANRVSARCGPVHSCQ
jgi:hypothetical protein